MTAKTDAERMKEYRQRKRNAERNENVTVGERNVTVTKSPTIPRESPKGDKLTFADLPADVQASIETHCSENNNGARQASHSRAAMTERAIRYQQVFGKRPNRATYLNKVYALKVAEIIGHDIGAEPLGPLDVYSAERWAWLQDKGYEWQIDKAVDRAGVVAVPVPGDPAYGAKATGHRLIVKCGP